jgi:hypothetical protein
MLKRLVLKSLLSLVFFVFWALPVLAQVDTAWVRTYNGPGDSTDLVHGIATDRYGNVYVTGWSYGSGTENDYATIKYYSTGDTAWVRRYNGPANRYDLGWAIAVDDSGRVYVTGISYGTGTENDYTTIRYYPDGDTAWVRRYDGPENSVDEPHALITDKTGNVYVTGASVGVGTAWDYLTIKYDANGDTSWVRRYNALENSYDVAHAIAVDDSGNVCVTGCVKCIGGHGDYATVRYDSAGNELWVATYQGPGDSSDIGLAIAVDGAGNVYVTGYSYGNGTKEDCTTIKYYSNGDTAWVRRYNGPADSDDWASAIAVDGAGNVYVAGTSKGNGTSYDYLTIKYHSNGDTAWVRRYDGPTNGSDGARDIALDCWGNVYVTGRSRTTETDYDIVTIKYYPNGDTSWVKRYDGPGDSYEEASVIVVDESANIYIAGAIDSSTTENSDYVTIKYHQHNEPPNPFSLLFPPNKAFTPRGVHLDWETATDPNPFDQVRYDLYVSTSYRFPLDSTAIDADLVASEHIKALDYGTYYWKVKAKDNFGAERWSNQVCYFMVTGIHYSGDINGNGFIDIADVVFLINYLYISGPAPEPLKLGDVNCDNEVNVADVVFLLNHLFRSGPAPSC